MTHAIVRKALADLRTRPLQAALLFAVIAAAATTLSLALNVRASAAEPAERLRTQANGADLWVNIHSAAADFDALRRLPSVREVSGPFPISWANYGLRQGDKKQQIALLGMPPELPTFDHPVVTNGRWLRAGATDEIVVDRGAARHLGLTVGQRVDLLTSDGAEMLVVVGFAVPSGRAPAPINDPAFAFVLPETLSRLEPEAIFGSSPEFALRAGIGLANPDDAFQFSQEVRPVLKSFDARSWTDVRENLEESNQFDVIFLEVFSVFALAAAALIIVNATGGQVLSQLRETAILKAIGFTPWQVTVTLLAQNVSLALAGGLAGAIAGLALSPVFLERTADVLGVPASPAFDPFVLAISIAAATVVVALVTLVPALRAGRASAIASLSAEDNQSTRPSHLASLASSLGLPAVAVVGLKDLSGRPMRTAMTVAALVLAVVTATFSLGIEATFEATMSDPTVIGGPPYDLGVDRDTYPDAETRRLLDSRPEVEGYYAIYRTGASFRQRGFDVQGIEGDLNNPQWAVREGRMPEGAGEAAVSTGLARELGVKVGDRIEVLMPSFATRIPVELEIVGRLAYIDGNAMFVKPEALPPGQQPTEYGVRTRPGTDNRKLASVLVQESGGNLDPEVLETTIGDVRDQFRSVLVALNAVLFGIAGLNLLSSLLLSSRERRRDFAVLKAIGFTPAQVGQSVLAGSVALAGLALVLGLPLGLVATRLMFDMLSSAAGIGTGVGRMPDVLWLTPLVPAALAIAVLGTVIPAHRVASASIAESLRYE